MSRSFRTLCLLPAVLAAGMAGGDAIRIQNASGDAVIVVDGPGADGCPDDLVLEGHGTIPLEAAAPEPGKCEIAVFSRNRAALRDAAPDWTHDPAPPVALHLLPRLTIEVHAWVPAGYPRAASWARSELALATRLFNDNRVGVRFTMASLAQYTAAEASILSRDCSSVNALKHAPARAGGPEWYVDKRINVIFVETVVQGGSDWQGYTCFEHDAANVIYMSLDAQGSRTLAHELGHALGLQLQSGHTNPFTDPGMAKFDERNLMYSNLDAERAEARDRFSVGQAYRMNFHDGSWLNQVGLGQGGARRCQAKASTPSPCPLLSLQP